MKPVEYWRWRIPDERRPGRTTVTSWLMSAETALARYPTAERVPGSMEIRQLPESDEDIARNLTSAMFSKPSS
ncbi:MAG: hypothetical protein K2Q07_09890 [Burkholderiaceae bacterium]|nr:hypothetical protein [Burkholderiaceae bacterium]